MDKGIRKVMSIRFITSLDICGICDATTFAHDGLRVVQELSCYLLLACVLLSARELVSRVTS